MNRGAIALQRVMKKEKLSQGDVQRALGIDKGVVSRWVRGLRKPNTRNALELSKRFGVRMEQWLEEAPTDAGA